MAIKFVPHYLFHTQRYILTILAIRETTKMDHEFMNKIVEISKCSECSLKSGLLSSTVLFNRTYFYYVVICSCFVTVAQRQTKNF